MWFWPPVFTSKQCCIWNDVYFVHATWRPLNRKKLSDAFVLVLHCFALWLASKIRATFEKQNQLSSAHFPALYAMELLCFCLIGSLECLHLLWLVSVITLVLVLRHSLGNHSNNAESAFNRSFCLSTREELESISILVIYSQAIGLIHTAAILSRETEKALFYHPRPRSEKFGSEARQVRQSNFSLSRQNGCCVNKAHCSQFYQSNPNMFVADMLYASFLFQVREGCHCSHDRGFLVVRVSFAKAEDLC